ncbi:phage GP46 family protein [Rahnella sp. NRRL B-41462]|uniref:phage GP46 family protein n=1 Tax=Rahnella sp. NRRL B-41462 TaxID=1610579 RepID=UPI000DD3CF38|nr:phage GP46 family protein [Rahnella sp. NRRL B-41462]
MTDITTVWNAEQSVGDWAEALGDLQQGDDLETAILISLFTDRLAREDDEYDGDNRRGWWGDQDQDYSIGSRLWLLRRQKLTLTVANKAQDFAAEALKWLTDDGVVSSITPVTQIVYPNRLNLFITYQMPGQDAVSKRYFWVWES